MRTIGVICVCLSVIGCGVLYDRRCRQRETLLAGFASFFGALAMVCVSLGGPMERILHGAAADADGRFSFPETLLSFYAQTGDPCAAWTRALGQLGAQGILKTEETALLSSFENAFTLPSMAAFTEECRGYEARYAALADLAHEKRRREERLCVTMTSLLAMLMFILLI